MTGGVAGGFGPNPAAEQEAQAVKKETAAIQRDLSVVSKMIFDGTECEVTSLEFRLFKMQMTGNIKDGAAAPGAMLTALRELFFAGQLSSDQLTLLGCTWIYRNLNERDCETYINSFAAEVAKAQVDPLSKFGEFLKEFSQALASLEKKLPFSNQAFNTNPHPDRLKGE